MLRSRIAVIFLLVISCSAEFARRSSMSAKVPSSLEYIGVLGDRAGGMVRFADPGGLCFDRRGRLYVADTGNDRIVVLSSEGQRLYEIGHRGWGAGGLDGPVDVVVGSDLIVFVVDGGNERIEKFSVEGDPVGSVPLPGEETLWRPAGAVIGATGDLYLSDLERDRVVRLNRLGRISLELGGYGRWEGQFDNPRGLALADDQSLYVADSRNGRVAIFDALGAWSGSLMGGDLVTPWGLSIDAGGNLFVTDPGSDRVCVYGAGGTFLFALEGDACAPGGLREPKGIAFDGDRLVYVSDSGNNRIQIFRVDYVPADD